MPKIEIGLSLDGKSRLQKQEEAIRNERDVRLCATNWLVERHGEQVAAKKPTSLTVLDYELLLSYRQALRDVPQAEGFPWRGDVNAAPWPQTLSFL